MVDETGERLELLAVVIITCEVDFVLGELVSTVERYETLCISHVSMCSPSVLVACERSHVPCSRVDSEHGC